MTSSLHLPPSHAPSPSSHPLLLALCLKSLGFTLTIGIKLVQSSIEEKGTGLVLYLKGCSLGRDSTAPSAFNLSSVAAGGTCRGEGTYSALTAEALMFGETVPISTARSSSITGHVAKCTVHPLQLTLMYYVRQVLTSQCLTGNTTAKCI